VALIGELRRDVPELTLDVAMQVLRSAFTKPALSEHEAIALVGYHLQRNRTAQTVAP
jgi:hypothetical protein